MEGDSEGVEDGCIDTDGESLLVGVSEGMDDSDGWLDSDGDLLGAKDAEGSADGLDVGVPPPGSVGGGPILGGKTTGGAVRGGPRIVIGGGVTGQGMHTPASSGQCPGKHSHKPKLLFTIPCPHWLVDGPVEIEGWVETDGCTELDGTKLGLEDGASMIVMFKSK